MHLESIKIFEKKKKSNNMVVIDIKYFLNMQNKGCLSKYKIIIKCGKTPDNNPLKCF